MPHHAFPDLDASIRAVTDDVVTALEDQFRLVRADGFRQMTAGRLDDRDMVQWEYDGIAGPSFLDLGGDDTPITVRGVTLVFEDAGEDGEPVTQFSRFVDWIGVYGQLGMTIAWRRPIPGGPDEEG